jgi:hypothetical protein
VLQKRLLRLYPRAWRERYGEEFLEIVGDGPLHPQQVIDIVSGAIDAWLSADVRRATIASRGTASRGGSTMLKNLMACDRRVRFTTRDSLIGAGVMIGASWLFVMFGVSARRSGLPVTGEALTDFSFLGALTLSMPFWLMKGQSWKAQTAFVGITLVLLLARLFGFRQQLIQRAHSACRTSSSSP